MSSMIYTQGHIGEEMYKLLESLTSLPNQGGQKSNRNKCEMTKIRLFLLFFFFQSILLYLLLQNAGLVTQHPLN